MLPSGQTFTLPKRTNYISKNSFVSFSCWLFKQTITSIIYGDSVSDVDLVYAHAFDYCL